MKWIFKEIDFRLYCVDFEPQSFERIKRELHILIFFLGEKTTIKIESNLHGSMDMAAQ